MCSGQVELNGLFFCRTPSTSTDFNDDRRRIRVRLQVCRVHRHQAGNGREQQFSVVRADGGRLRPGGTFAGEKRAAGNFFAGVGGKISQRFFSNAHQPFIRTKPEIAQIVLDEIADVVAGQAVGCGATCPAAVREPREAVAESAGPQHAFTVRPATRKYPSPARPRRKFSRRGA